MEFSAQEKAALESQHKKERDKRICDRIKALLLISEGWSLDQISQALRIHLETVRTHIDDYKRESKLKPENGESKSLLSDTQTQQ